MAKCDLCGEPMPVGEEMFKFHGYSGPCPVPHKVPSEPPSAIAPQPAADTHAFDNGSGMTELMTPEEMIAEIQRLGRLLVAGTAAPQWPELIKKIDETIEWCEFAKRTHCSVDVKHLREIRAALLPLPPVVGTGAGQ